MMSTLMISMHQAASPQDSLRSVLDELEGVPNVAYQEGSTAPVTLVLTNRFADVRGASPTAALRRLRS
jgi:hypothetical protein